MAANGEKLQVVLTGYDCLDILQAINIWIERGMTHKSEASICQLKNRIYNQYHHNERLPVEEEV